MQGYGAILTAWRPIASLLANCIINEDGQIGRKQISEAGYNAFWKEDDDIKLYNYLKSIDEKGSSFMVSGDSIVTG